jgi:hypothetical protein
MNAIWFVTLKYSYLLLCSDLSVFPSEQKFGYLTQCNNLWCFHSCEKKLAHPILERGTSYFGNECVHQLKLDLYTCSMLTSHRGISENVPVGVNMNVYVLYIYQSVTLLQNPNFITALLVQRRGYVIIIF